MKSLKKISVTIVLLAVCMLLSLQSNDVMAQNWASMAPYDILWALFPPVVSPVNPLTGITTPFLSQPFSLFTRTAAIPLPGAGGAVTAPTIIITDWSGSWFSFVTNSLGAMTLTLTENLSTGFIDGTVWFILHRLVPVPVTVSGTYTGIGTAFVLTGVYTDFQPAFGGLVLIPTDYLITVEGEITTGTLLTGSYAIESLQQSDFGGFNLNAI
ncbi:MAG: hypothetical protein ACMUIP_08380 [bacterium]